VDSPEGRSKRKNHGCLLLARLKLLQEKKVKRRRKAFGITITQQKKKIEK